MDKENATLTPRAPAKGITEAQRARISQNFRAAKALLAHKNGIIGSIQSHPLAEIELNTPSPIPIKGFRLTESKCIRSCPERIFIKKSDDRVEGPNIENGVASTLIETSAKKLECSSLSDAFSSPSVLDEDFDNTILEEIDVLCDQRSATKIEGQEPCSNASVGSQFNENSNGDDNANLESVTAKKLLETEGKLDFRDDLELETEGSSTSQAIQSGRLLPAYSEYLQSLNDKQQEAACSDISIPLMIVAGPGSGKTSTMVGRVLMLLNEGIGPSNILAMTFTTAAASEMRDRIGAVAGKAAAKELLISTFHSFALQFCRSHAEKLGRTSEFLIYGPGQQRRAIIEAVRLLENERKNGQNLDACLLGEDSNGINCAQYFKDKSKKWQKFVTQAKASGKTLAECRKMGDETGAAILRNYNDILQSCNALDYHDLISCSVKLLSDYPEVLKECQESWKAIVIDEFQDTSAMQYSLLQIIASHNHITIVGDEDQSIFSFNGADISGFDSFRKDFPNYKEIRLSKNYRSTRCIVEAASSLIHNNLNRCQLKQAFTDNSSGHKITVKECHSEDAQCAFVVDKILETTSDGSAAKCSFGNIAILYRRQVSGKVFQTVFRDRKIPFNIHGVAFYRKKVSVILMLQFTKISLTSMMDDFYKTCFMEGEEMMMQRSESSDLLLSSRALFHNCICRGSDIARRESRLKKMRKRKGFIVYLLVPPAVAQISTPDVFKQAVNALGYHSMEEKEIIKAIMAMLRTTLPGCDDGPFRQVFKALLPCEKEEKKRVVDYIDKISTIRKCSFISAAGDIFAAKISGTFKRSLFNHFG
ncbi:hypothetical protein HHK36_000435 [Tetracentron sinense]|uniref:DNA 3'-5' helicase n=1 Tax=Tetracentron sinense TaxID=13715 RepID=A0A835DQR9_TETSI|nr:hypothetical protein HHK36_000435 [Tetracentron sinense]